LIEIFEKAARKAMFAWKQNTEGVEDLANDLWVWYLERPAVQKQLQEADEFLARDLAYRAALQILKGESLADDLFNGRNMYSSESVKDALKGRSTNRYLVDILPIALKELEAKNEGYAEALRKRYIDGIIPKGKDSDELLHAHRSVTEHVNIIAIRAGVDPEGRNTQGPGSRHAVFPETRKEKGSDHSDPTADLAINLVEGFTHGKETVFADDPIPLGFYDEDGNDVDNGKFTTLRKEYVG
jgi:hypothetical protein